MAEVDLNPRSLTDAFLSLWFFRASGTYCMNQKSTGSILGHPKALLAGTVDSLCLCRGGGDTEATSEPEGSTGHHRGEHRR
ncbi:dynein light chain roadblock-type 1 isoform X2 [Callorhinus ursinus]|uniref:dynein light chain roadblock-type 1 isoform X2 n=1 Tax=Callorhinus ursinus TaxID=34884 RepID=UPI003CD03447